ncbi:MAG: mannose-1-phosphate guanylyltransferase/mannose-6-phosphate isomerase [Gammaproteobacteria bacterium]|nr:mannose-1-phosphate guanylyltransferase/mannose-6-phosphate isomerase [Gammaproteobacteria bacterium]
MTKIKPVILSGGSGTRLWPLSRQLYPKQLLPLVGEHTLLQDTVMRARAVPNSSDSVLVVCNEEHRFLIAEQLREINAKTDPLVLEPQGRNTAPALTLAALALEALDPHQVMLVMPADHVIKDTTAFSRAVEHAVPLAAQGYVVTFGIVPSGAETGFGYLQRGAVISETPPAYVVQRFVEKPDPVSAQAYVDSGKYLWNSGIFMLRVSVWLTYLGQFQPQMLACCRSAYHSGKADQDFYRVDKPTFADCPSDSIDYAVMEKLTGGSTLYKLALIPLQAGWSDVGAWGVVWEISDKDPAGNVTHGDVISIDNKNTLLHSQHRLLAGVGLDDIMVVETVDAVLVAHRAQAQAVKTIVDTLKQQQREEHVVHRRVYRPWGSYEGIDWGERYQVKRITVSPGAALSLQMHHHRAEHWVVVKGTAKVTRDNEIFLVAENQSTYIPIGVKHRLENPGTIPLEMIEIQSGGYLGEDDIVRFDDKYGRTV